MAETGGKPIGEGSIVIKADVQAAADIQKATPEVTSAVNKLQDKVNEVGKTSKKASIGFLELAGRITATVGALKRMYDGIKEYQQVDAEFVKSVNAIKDAFKGIGGSEVQGVVTLREQIEATTNALKDEARVQKSKQGFVKDALDLLFTETEYKAKLLQIDNERANALEKIERLEQKARDEAAEAAKKNRESVAKSLLEQAEQLRISQLEGEDRVNAEAFVKKKQLYESVKDLAIEQDKKLTDAIRVNLDAIEDEQRRKLKAVSNEKKKQADDEAKRAADALKKAKEEEDKRIAQQAKDAVDEAKKAADAIGKAIEGALSKINVTEIEARIGAIAGIVEVIARKLDSGRDG